MRGRPAVAFLLPSLVLVMGVLLIRDYTVGERVRANEASDLSREAAATALLIELRSRLGEPVDEAFLRALVGTDGRIE